MPLLMVCVIDALTHSTSSTNNTLMYVAVHVVHTTMGYTLYPVVARTRPY